MSSRAPALQGNLSDFPLPSVLRLLGGSGRSGVLRFYGAYSAAVCFDGGQAYFGVPNRAPSLRQLFVDSGAVDAQAWETAVASAGRSGDVAEALVTDGGADRDKLVELVHEQVVVTLFELLLLGDGDFEFRPDEVHPAGALTRWPVDDILDEAAERVATWKDIATSVPSTSVVMRMAPALPEETAEALVGAEEWPVLAALDGQRTVAEVIRSLGTSAFEVCGSLHRMRVAGWVELVDQPPAASS